MTEETVKTVGEGFVPDRQGLVCQTTVQQLKQQLLGIGSLGRQPQIWRQKQDQPIWHFPE